MLVLILDPSSLNECLLINNQNPGKFGVICGILIGVVMCGHSCSTQFLMRNLLRTDVSKQGPFLGVNPPCPQLSPQLFVTLGVSHQLC